MVFGDREKGKSYWVVLALLGVITLLGLYFIEGAHETVSVEPQYNPYKKTTDPGSKIRRLVDGKAQSKEEVILRRQALDLVQQKLERLIELTDSINIKSYLSELPEDSGQKFLELLEQLKGKKSKLQLSLHNTNTIPLTEPYYDAADVALVKTALPELYFTLADVFSVSSGSKFKQADKLERYLDSALPDIAEAYFESKRKYTDFFSGKSQNRLKAILQVHDVLLFFITCETKGSKCHTQLHIF